MKELWSIYHQEMPLFLDEFRNTKTMLRLKNIGMNCGVEYTSFERFNNIKYYSRYDHSVSVALIIYHFTNDIKQSLAGLFHDLSTPTFAHCIDFMNGDYLKQESTESYTVDFILSDDIIELLNKYNLTVEEVKDYHQYPIADNPSPKLSSDRLEYTLGNMYNFGFSSLEQIKMIYNDIIVDGNELAFQSKKIAELFFEGMLNCAKIYICDEDRLAMELLSRIIHYGINHNVLLEKDLYSSEKLVLEKLNNSILTKDMIDKYQRLYKVGKTNIKLNNSYKVIAKKRYINPLVNGVRLSKLDDKINKELMLFINSSLDYFIYIKEYI